MRPVLLGAMVVAITMLVISVASLSGAAPAQRTGTPPGARIDQTICDTCG